MSTEDKTSSLKDLLNRIIEGKIDANRRYVDEVLEKIQHANHRYYLEKLVFELAMMEMEEKAGDKQAAFRHKVMVDTYKSILEKTFGITQMFGKKKIVVEALEPSPGPRSKNSLQATLQGHLATLN